MTTCPFCEAPTDYDRIATHWTQSPTCRGPTLTDDQRSIAIGLLLSGAHFVEPGVRRYPSLQFSTTRQEFAEWVMDEMGILGPDHPPEKMDRSDDTDWEFGDDAEFWRVTTRSARVWSELRSTPTDDYAMTPLTLRVWYARRGQYRQASRSGHQLRLGTARTGETPFYWAERLDEYGWHPMTHDRWEGLRISNEADTRVWFDTIGESLPGYADKWPPFAADEGSKAMRHLQRSGPAPLSSLPYKPTLADRRKGVAVFTPARFKHLSTAIAYIEGVHDLTDVVRTYLQVNDGILERYSPMEVHRQIAGFGAAWKEAAATVIRDEMGLAISTGGQSNPAARDAEGMTHQQSLKLAAERHEDERPETISLEPDWEWLADELERIGLHSWAEDAREERLTKREVYGPVLTLLYRFRHASPEDIARL